MFVGWLVDYSLGRKKKNIFYTHAGKIDLEFSIFPVVKCHAQVNIAAFPLYRTSPWSWES